MTVFKTTAVNAYGAEIGKWIFPTMAEAQAAIVSLTNKIGPPVFAEVEPGEIPEPEKHGELAVVTADNGGVTITEAEPTQPTEPAPQPVPVKIGKFGPIHFGRN